MSVESAVAAGRRAATGRMQSRAAVMRKTGAMTTDASGLEVPEWATVYADAPFRLGGSQQGGSGTRTVTIGGVEIQVATRVGSFPHDHDLLSDGDLIDITAGENEGVVLRIVEAAWQDQSTARRVPVVSEQRPEEWA